MRRVILAVSLAVLAALVAVRAATARPAADAAAAGVSWPADTYNVLALDRPSSFTGTAGSTLLAELDDWFFSRTPTKKSGYTGLLAGHDLILLLAEDWNVEAADAARGPALRRLLEQGVRFRDAYAPDWYQGADGRQFALLTGLEPTCLGETTAMDWIGAQGTYLPFALGTCLAAAGYDCRAYGIPPERQASFRALGFAPEPEGAPDQVLPGLGEDGPFAAFFVLDAAGAEQTLDRLWQTLAETGREDDTLLCLASGGGEDLRGSLTLWSAHLEPAEVPGPCSELDVAATLLDLLGAAYDSRFLSGRDLLSENTGGRPVVLGGSAWADWVTDAGVYRAADGQFVPADGRFSGPSETARYVLQMRQAVYEQYIYARQALERDYFQSRFGHEKLLRLQEK